MWLYHWGWQRCFNWLQHKEVRMMFRLRQATAADLPGILATYEAHFAHEETHTRYTIFARGIYPTAEYAAAAISNGSMFVAVDATGEIVGRMILDAKQPTEYKDVMWGSEMAGEVLVLHLLLVPPQHAGKGIASQLLRFAEESALQRSCRAVRLDTGAQNLPAVGLYQTHGYRIVARQPRTVGDKIAHDNHLYLEKVLGRAGDTGSTQ